MADFEIHPVGTTRRIAELENQIAKLADRTLNEKADMKYVGQILDAGDGDDIPVFLKPQAD